jgi:cytochrome c
MKRKATLARWAVALLLGLAPVAALADPLADGKSAFHKCGACHSVTGHIGIGPYLNGVVGRRAGSIPGFLYSRAMKTIGIVWTAEMLDAYLKNPQAAVPGNHMPFSGIASATERANIIAYLASEQ